MDEYDDMSGMETSADMIMPLPLTEEQIDNLTDENYTTEVTDVNFELPKQNNNNNDAGRAIFPGNPFLPNLNNNITIIP